MKMQIVCNRLLTNGAQIVHHLHGHMPGEWRRFLHWSTAKSTMACEKSDHMAIKHSFSTLRTLNERKQNVGILHDVNLYIYFHDIWQTCWIDDKKSHLKRVLRA